MKRTFARAVAVLCLSAAAAAPAFAAEVTWNASGTFTLGGGVSTLGDATWLGIGDLFTFSFTGNSESGNSTVLGTIYSLVGTPTITLTDSLDSTKHVQLSLASGFIGNDFLRLLDRSNIESVNAQAQTSAASGHLRLNGNLGSLLSGEALTNTPPSLLGANVLNDFALIWKDKNEYFSLAGPVTSLTASPVPLPAAAWLLLSGMGGIGAFVRKRRSAIAA